MHPERPPAVAISGYEILEELSHGTLGVVYKARHLGQQRLVALKLLRPGNPLSDAQLRAFLRAAEAAAALQHPNVAQVLDFGVHEGNPYFAQEFLGGGSLHRKLSGRPLPPAHAAHLVEQLARAAHHAHQLGIVHGELNPYNVLLTEYGTPKITDFANGGALAAGNAAAAEPDSPGSLSGIPTYLSPEQARGERGRVGPATDVYALGAILYECLTGRPPLLGPTVLDTLMQVIRDEPAPPSRLQSLVPPELDAVCLACLNKDPAQRYPSADLLAEDLRRAQSGQPVGAHPVRSGPGAGMHPLGVVLLGVLILAAVALPGVIVYFSRELEHERGRAAKLEEQVKSGQPLLTGGGSNGRKDRGEPGRDPLRDRAEEKDKSDRQFDLLRRRLFAAQLQHAAALADWDPGRGLELLHDCGACPLDLRDAAWRYQERHSRRWEKRLLLTPPESIVYAVAFSPDGKTLAGAGGVPGWVRPGEVWLWDAATGEPRGKLTGHAGSVLSLAFAPDGKTLAVGTGAWDVKAGEFTSGEVKLWDLPTSKERAALTGYSSGVFAVAFSPDGKTLAIGSGVWEERSKRLTSGEVQLWDAGKGKVRATLGGHFGGVRGLAFAPDGKALVSAADDGSVKLWDPVKGKERARLEGHADGAMCAAFSSDGKFVATAGSEKRKQRWPSEIKLWDAATGAEVGRLSGHAGEVVGVAFAPDNRTLASCSGGGLRKPGEIKLWDLAQRRERVTLRGHGERVTSVAFTADGKTLASGSEDGTVRLWHTAPEPERTRLEGHLQDLTALALSPNGAWLASASADKGRGGRMKLTHLGKGEEKSLLKVSTEIVLSLAFSADGGRLALGIVHWDKSGKLVGHEVRLWDLAAGEFRISLKDLPAPVLALAFDPDGRTLATAGDDGQIKLWELRWNEGRGVEQKTLKGHTGPVFSLAFDRTGKTLASAGGPLAALVSPGEVKLWDVEKGDEKRALTAHAGGASVVRFTPDGKTVASGGKDGQIILWDVDTGQDRVTLTGHPEEVTALAFTPDGRTLASGSGDRFPLPRAGGDSAPLRRPGAIKLWDPVAGQERATLPGHAGGVFLLAWCADGKTLFSAGGEWTLLRHDLAPGPEYARLGEQDDSLSILALAYRPDGKTLVGACSNAVLGAVRFWDTTTGQQVAALRGAGGELRCLALAADGRTLACGISFWDDKLERAVTGEVRLLDLVGRTERTLTKPGGEPITAVVLSPDGKTLAAGATDGTVRRWELSGDADAEVLARLAAGDVCLAFSPDGRTLACGVSDGTVRLWDLAARKESKILKGPAGKVASVAFSPDGKTLAAASWQLDPKTKEIVAGELKLWDVEKGAVRVELRGHDGGVSGVAFSADSKTLASAGRDRTVRLWDAATGKLRTTLVGQGSPFLSVAISPDGRLVAAGTPHGQVQMWSIEGARSDPF